MSVRIGFLGAGLIAGHHSRLLRRSGHEATNTIVRAGVYDPDRARAEAFAAASGHHVCASEAEVLDSCDALYVCTWTSEHARLAQLGLQRGLHLFCEKPLATTLSDAESMLASAAAAGVSHQVGLILRYSPAYTYARSLIAAPASGPLQGLVFRDDQYIPTQGRYGSTWRADKARAGAGTLLEHSIHDLDMLEFLGGPVQSISARTSNFHGHEGIEDVAAVQVQYANGALGTLLSIWHDNLARPSLRRVEVVCANRFVTIAGDDDWSGPVTWQDADGYTGSLGGAELATEVHRLGLVPHDPPNPDRAFVDAVVERRPAYPDLSLAVRAQRLADAAYRSANEGGGSVEVSFNR